jgi:transposase
MRLFERQYRGDVDYGGRALNVEEPMANDDFNFFVGLDWGTASHAACVMDVAGQVIWAQTIEHNGNTISQFLQAVTELSKGEAQKVAVAIEVPHGPLVEACLESGYAVFAVNPKQLDRFRDRHNVAGAKDDRRDAFVAATSLRTDQRCFRRVTLDEPNVIRLRELSRLDEVIGEDLRRTVNQLFQVLLRYYPEMLQLCPTPDQPWLWALLEEVPTSQQAKKLTLRRIQTLLSKWRVRRWTAEQVHTLLKTSPLQLAPGTVEAMSEHALLLLPQLRQSHTQRKNVRDRIHALLQTMAESVSENDKNAITDVAVIQSMPGVGTTITAALLSEASDALRTRDYHALRSHGGTAPVTRQSGKSRQVMMRYGCNQRLRNVFYHWALCSVQRDPRSKQHYHSLRERGHSHSRALRGVADRLLAVLVAMLRSGETYEASRRLSAVLG